MDYCFILNDAGDNLIHHHHHHHRFLTPALWRRWVQMNDSHFPLGHSTSSMYTSILVRVMLTVYHNLCLPLFLFTLNFGCSALCVRLGQLWDMVARRFESHSSRRVGTVDKSFTRGCL